MTKSSDVRALLMETADRLFFEQGYDAVGVADICKAAGKAKGLFFYYFEKKENVVKELIEIQIRTMSAHLTEVMRMMTVTPDRKLRFLMNTMISRESPGPRALFYFKQEGIPDWLDFYTHDLKDKYIFPIIYETVCGITEESGNRKMTRSAVEIIYLGISAFMHRNHMRMADEIFYAEAVSAISTTLEKALNLPEGTMAID